jgi:hypothetical protein
VDSELFGACDHCAEQLYDSDGFHWCNKCRLLLCEDCEEGCNFFDYCDVCEAESCKKCSPVLFCDNGYCETALVRRTNLLPAAGYRRYRRRLPAIAASHKPAAADLPRCAAAGMQCTDCVCQENCMTLRCPRCKAFACLECRASALDGACLSCDAPLWTTLEVRQFGMRHSAMQRHNKKVRALRRARLCPTDLRLMSLCPSQYKRECA